MTPARTLSKFMYLAVVFVASLAQPGCGLPGADIHLDLLGTWGLSGPGLTLTNQYNLDGTYQIQVVTTPGSGPETGCTQTEVQRGRYTAEADTGTLTQTATAATRAASGCADPAANTPEAALPLAQGGMVTVFSYELRGDTLKLRRSGVTITLQKR